VAAGDRDFAQPELKPDGNDLLIQLHGAGIPEQRLGEPDGLDLQ
jgi:hypothetical protein